MSADPFAGLTYPELIERGLNAPAEPRPHELTEMEARMTVIEWGEAA